MTPKILAAIFAWGLLAGGAEAQVAYSRHNGACTTFNACWQRMNLPSGHDSQFSQDVRDRLRACAAAGGPDKYFGKGKGGPGKLRPCPGGQ